MAETFNSLGGYSVGIPPIPVIDANGNVVANVVSNGNIIVANVYANQYFWGNGQPLSTAAAGSNTQLQFNNNGQFGGIPDVTWNGTFLSLGDVSKLKISGGDNGYFLQTDGTGNLSWAAGGGGGGNGTPGGANTQVQFNDGGAFGGDSGFTYDKITNTLRVENITAGDTSDDTVNIIGNVAVSGNIELSGNLALGGSFAANGNLSADYFIGDGGLLSNITTDVANYVRQSNQANITSLGNLEFLNVDGNVITFGDIETSGNILAGNISLSSNINAGNGYFVSNVTVAGNLNIQSGSRLRVTGNINTIGSPNITLGTISNIHITGGVNGYVLATDGAGNLSWAAPGGGGGGNSYPAGSNTQIQYNNNGLFGASPYFTFNDYTNTVQIGGNLVANTLQLGAGVYRWSTSEVYFATTASMGTGQVLYSVPVTGLSGVEFDIIATEPAGPSRHSCKISSLYYNGTVQFSEYATMFINGGVGNFEVEYEAGNIITPPSLQLKVTPNTSNPVTYKMLITVFADN